MAALEAKKASLTTEVANLLKQNVELLKARKKDKIKVNALKKEFSEVQKSLKQVILRLANLENLHDKMDKLKDKSKELKI